MVKGGFIIIDDYQLPGCKKAVDEFLELQPSVMQLQEKAQYEQNIGVEKEVQKTQLEINAMNHKLFVIQLKTARLYDLLITASINQFMWN